MNNIFFSLKMLFCVFLAVALVAVAGGCNSTENIGKVPDEVKAVVNDVLNDARSLTVKTYLSDFIDDENVGTIVAGSETIGVHLDSLCGSPFKGMEYIYIEENKFEVNVEIKLLDFKAVVDEIIDEQFKFANKIGLVDSEKITLYGGKTLKEVLDELGNSGNLGAGATNIEQSKKNAVCAFIVEYMLPLGEKLYEDENNHLFATVYKKLVITKDGSEWVLDLENSDIEKSKENGLKEKYYFKFDWQSNTLHTPAPSNT